MNISTMNLCLFALCAVIVLLSFKFSEAKLKEGDCEVCITVVEKIEKQITEEDRKSPESLEKKIRKFCKSAKNSKENRFCYYIGGTADAATGMLKFLIDPMKSFQPADRICEKLKKKDPQICELKFEKQIDLDAVDLNKLRVKELKKILNDWGEECKGCMEKRDFIERINELRSKHAPKKEL